MKIILAILMLALIVPVQAQTLKPFTIEGDISGIKEKIDSIRIIYRANGVESDIAFPVKNGRFLVKGSISQPVVSMLYYFSPADTTRKVYVSTQNTSTALFIQPGKMNFRAGTMITDNTLTGSPYHTDFKEMEAKRKEYITRSEKELEKLRSEPDSLAFVRKYDNLMDSSIVYNVAIWSSYLNSKPQSPLVFYGIKRMMAFNHNFQGEHIKPFYEKLTPEMKDSYEGRLLKAMVTTGNGNIAPEFSQADTSGIVISLSSFRGKYVLLDFWGSWCNPCRRENPNMIKNFEKYKDRGFAILSVGAETDKDKWLAAIHKDCVGRWTHVSDLKGKNNEVSKLYCITAYPSNFLIDPSGKIIAQNLRGENLDKKLAEIFR